MSLPIHFLSYPGPFTFLLPLIIPMSLLLYSLGFLSPFTPSLPLFILVGFPTINPTISTCWACFLIPLLFSLSHILYIIGLLLLLGPLSKVSINRLILWCVCVLWWWQLAVLGCGTRSMCGWQCWVASISCRDYGLKRENQRGEKKYLNNIQKAIVTVHICITLLELQKLMQTLMWVLFWVKCVKLAFISIFHCLMQLLLSRKK